MRRQGRGGWIVGSSLMTGGTLTATWNVTPPLASGLPSDHALVVVMFSARFARREARRTREPRVEVSAAMEEQLRELRWTFQLELTAARGYAGLVEALRKRQDSSIWIAVTLPGIPNEYLNMTSLFVFNLRTMLPVFQVDVRGVASLHVWF